MVEHLDKCPLCPFIIFRIASSHFPVPVERKTDFIELFPIAGNIFLCCNGRMLSCLDGILFGWQTICIESHRMQHIESFQTFISGINVGCDVAEWVADVQTGSGRIREHIQYIKFRFGRIDVDFVSLIFFPVALPLFLYLLKVVFHDNIDCL